ncbi:hypothetical protein ScPMuIL_012678 [Solemya velum]
MFLLLFYLSLSQVNSVLSTGGVLQVDYPDVSVNAPDNGNITLQGGRGGGSVLFTPGPGRVVYFEDVDLLELLMMIRSLPPVWIEHSSVGFYGTFYGGDRVNVKLEAQDPEGGNLTYEVVAGALPAGVTVDKIRGVITGIAPDEEALYVVTIRAIDPHEKFADAVYTMETHEKNQCVPYPCVNGGLCTNAFNDFNCSCSAQYGGKRCEIACLANPLGVGNRAIIPDAHMTAFLTQEPGDFWSNNGRLGMSGNGWCGKSNLAWLQIDLGAPSRVYAVSVQGRSTSYYTRTYSLSHSLTGSTFTTLQTPATNTTKIFTANPSTVDVKVTLPAMIDARFIRFHPLTYASAAYPCMKVEVYGCKP